jgi:hypothetical protein
MVTAGFGGILLVVVMSYLFEYTFAGPYQAEAVSFGVPLVIKFGLGVLLPLNRRRMKRVSSEKNQEVMNKS